MTAQSRRLEGHQLKREPEQRPAQVVGGAPHGFGVWIDGEFHRVDIGALGTVIVKLTGELEAARKELVEQRQPTQSPQPESRRQCHLACRCVHGRPNKRGRR